MVATSMRQGLSWAVLSVLLGPVAACGGAGSGTAAPGGAGGGSISGSVSGTPFTSAKTVVWIGAPDSAATTVVYMFSSAVTCSDLQAAAWDTRIPDRSLVLEMKMFGTTAPAAFTVTTSPTPAPGEVAVNTTVSSRTGTPVETASTGGSVALAALSAGARASGTFHLDYADGSTLTGSFEAIFCPGGHEP